MFTNLLDTFPASLFSQNSLLLLLLLVVHKVSRSTFHGHVNAFYSDNKQLYRFSLCRTFKVVGHFGTFGASLSVQQFFFLSSILGIFR